MGNESNGLTPIDFHQAEALLQRLLHLDKNVTAYNFSRKSSFTESSITCQSSLISESIESRPTTFQGNRHLQNLLTESSITCQSSLISESIESRPTTFQGNRHLQNLPTESSSILQPSLISESIELLPTTPQENIEIFEPDVSDNNDSTQDANILTENDASTDDYQIVCVRAKNYVQKYFHFIKLTSINLNIVHYPISKIKKNTQNY
ncbi:hypothetical protein TNCT_452111 [Trichonephila clavata]|uniref:Uncharacterized protein n=1 Tax=Trichonephila clavata TaxID=2740835 RepID=A0A8X6HF05_TRICU|nr:hypothetical protein TNCT_452111 [Trichonephila clavata]